MRAERLFDLLTLAAAQQTVIDEHTREAIPDRPMHQRGRDGGIDAT
jgi:hypothetical protein